MRPCPARQEPVEPGRPHFKPIGQGLSDPSRVGPRILGQTYRCNQKYPKGGVVVVT